MVAKNEEVNPTKESTSHGKVKFLIEKIESTLNMNGIDQSPIKPTKPKTFIRTAEKLIILYNLYIENNMEDFLSEFKLLSDN